MTTMRKVSNIYCSTTQLSETQLRTLFSSEKCCQGIVYVGMSRKHCLVFLTCLFLFLLYLFALLAVPNSLPPPPPPLAAAVLGPSTFPRGISAAFAAISDADLRPSTPRELIQTLKNPCWFQEQESDFADREQNPYEGNPYVHVSSRARKSFERLLRQRAQRQQTGRKQQQRQRQNRPHHLFIPFADANDDAMEGSRSRLRCVPYFYIAGMPKCGTTDLYARLTRHPEITGGVMKEPHWWTRKRFGALHPQNSNLSTPPNPASFRHYVDLFDEAARDILEEGIVESSFMDDESTIRSQKIIVDASASFLWDNDGWLNYLNWTLASDDQTRRKSGPVGSLPPLMAAHLRHLHPDAKLVVMLRDPVKRLYSDYLYFRLNSQKTVDNFHDRVVKSIGTFRECRRVHSLAACVYAPEINSVATVSTAGSNSSASKRPVSATTSVRLRLGIYGVFLRDWFRWFPRDQILVLRLEDYAADTDETLKRIHRFLGVTTTDGDRPEKREGKEAIANRRYVDIGPMKNETETLLREFYAEYNEALAQLMGDRRFLWADE